MASCRTSASFLSRCWLGVQPCYRPGTVRPSTTEHGIFKPVLFFSLLLSLSGRRDINRDRIPLLCPIVVLCLWNLALILGLIALLLQIPWRITVLGNAQEILLLSLTYEQSAFQYWRFTHRCVSKPQTTPVRLPVCTTAKCTRWTPMQRGSSRLQKSTVNKSSILRARFVPRGNIFHSTS